MSLLAYRFELEGRTQSVHAKWIKWETELEERQNRVCTTRPTEKEKGESHKGESQGEGVPESVC